MTTLKINYIETAKAVIHGIIPFIIAFMFHSFKGVMLGYFYIVFSGYIYYFIKKDVPLAWSLLILFYVMFFSFGNL